MARTARETPEVEANPAPNRRWILALVLLFFAIAWTISLATYSPEDWPEGSGNFLGQSENALGMAGSGFAYWSFQLTFGRYLTVFIPLLLCWVSAGMFFRSYRLPWVKVILPLIGGVWLAANWIAQIQFWQYGFVTFRDTGAVAGSLIEWLWSVANGFGATLTLSLLSLIWIGLTLLPPLLRVRKLRPELQSSKAEERTAVVKAAKRKLQISKEKALSEVDEPERETRKIPLVVPPKPIAPPSESIQTEPMQTGTYTLPSYDMFQSASDTEIDEEFEELAEKLHQTLREFNVTAKIHAIHPGPVVTRYDFIPGPGVKVSSFASLSDDLARAMRAKSVRILAPIPGEEAVGIEIPNRRPRIVRFREIVESAEFQKAGWQLPVAVGLTTDGQPMVTDLAKLPHLLIAGTTGSGKSVFINCLLASILLKKTPEEVRIALIDPKQLELSPYKALVKHHLVQLAGADPVVTKPAQAVKLLQACVVEMTRRLDLLTQAGVRDLREYQEQHQKGNAKATEPLSYIIVVIDELADLMLASAKEIEDPIQRISQMARAVGIHLVLATQRPSVNVITGVIKANMPARMAFQVASQVDSRTILDQTGADKLLGRGDGLFAPPWEMKPVRVHGGLVETSEIEQLLAFIAAQPQVAPYIMEPPTDSDSSDDSDANAGDRDALFEDAARVVVRAGQGSVAIIQRRLRVGYSRAGRLLDQLEQAGIVGRFDGSKPREVLVSIDTLDEMFGTAGRDEE